MEKSKFSEILDCLSPRERKRFSDFLHSPYFNRDESLLAFWESLQETPASKKKKKVWDAKQISYLSSDLNRLAESFLAFQRIEEMFLILPSLSLDALSERNLDKHYGMLLRKTRKEEDAFPYRNTEYYFGKFQLENVEMRGFGRKKVRAFDEHLNEASQALDHYYFLIKLKLSCELVNRSRILAAEYDPAPLDDLLHMLAHPRFGGVPAIAIYIHILGMLREEEKESHFDALMKLLREHPKVFNPDEQKEVYAYIRNYCINRIKNGRQRFQRILFDIYRDNLEQGLMHDGEFLSPWNFKNIVSIGLLLDETSWTKRFIEKRVNELAPEFRESALHFNMGNLHYHRKEFGEALRSLTRVRFTDVFYSLDTRRILLKTYFEENETEAFLSLVSSFRVYLRRNRLISEANRKAYLHFVNFAAQLYRIPRGKARLIRPLLQKIQSTPSLIDEDWLEDKAKAKMGHN